MDGYSIVRDKGLVNTDLLLLQEPSLPEAMRQLNLCEPFVGLLNGRCVAVCLLAQKKNHYEVTNLAIDSLPEQVVELGYDLLYHALDFVRVKGGRFVEIGAGNAEIDRHKTLQLLGFRVVGVWPDYFPQQQKETPHGNIVNRDMLRYRVDLQDIVPEE